MLQLEYATPTMAQYVLSKQVDHTNEDGLYNAYVTQADGTEIELLPYLSVLEGNMTQPGLPIPEDIFNNALVVTVSYNNGEDETFTRKSVDHNFIYTP